MRRGYQRFLGAGFQWNSEYRDLWELPYTEEVRFGLLKSFLQSRAVISWINSLKETRQFDLSGAIIVYRDGAQVAGDSIGGDVADRVLDKAREIERLIYDVNASLVPPAKDKLPSGSLAPYHPFDAIEEIVVKDVESGDAIHLRPLVMLDDVHALHPKQLLLMQDWLSKREMKISRWILMRLDAQTPESVLREGIISNDGIDSEATIKRSREITQIWLQRSDDRRVYREKFRKMAKSMADKYLRMMPVFSQRGAKFQNLLNTQPKPISVSNFAKLLKKVEAFQKQANIGREIRRSLEVEVEQYFSGSRTLDSGDDVKLAMLQILLHRYVKRVPQASLFDDADNGSAPEPNVTIKANSDVADGARIHLLHEFKRPYYYGIDAVCDGSSENAEQFLQLAGRLVGASEVRIINGKSADLSSSYQDRLLRERATEIIREWTFPKHRDVRKLCSHIAEQCLEKSKEPNASLGGGANAFGIPQKEFDAISEEHPELAHILKYGIAYNAISIKPYHKTKNRDWTLIELTGPFLIEKGLTFTRGGFLEKQVKDLLNPLEGA